MGDLLQTAKSYKRAAVEEVDVIPADSLERGDRRAYPSRPDQRAGERKKRKRSRSRSRERDRGQQGREGGYRQARREDADLKDADPEKDFVELFIGNIVSLTTTEDELKNFFNEAMRQVGLAGNEDPVVGCRIGPGDKFGFVVCRTREDATKAMNLNGVPFLGANLRVGRPAKYSGPATPSLTWQELTKGNPALSQGHSLSHNRRERNEPTRHDRRDPPNRRHERHELSRRDRHEPSSRHEPDSRRQPVRNGLPAPHVDKRAELPDPRTKAYREIFVGNTQVTTTNEALKDFLGNAMIKMGMAHSTDNPIFEARVSGKFAFLEFTHAEDAANCLNLDGIPFQGTDLKITRPSKFDGEMGVLAYSWRGLYQLWQTGQLKLMTAGVPTRVVMITNMATAQELLDPLQYLDIIEDTRLECSRYGTVRSVIVPRNLNPSVAEASHANIGKVFVEMLSSDQAQQVVLALKGRTFNNRIVDIKFYPEQDFAAMNYSYNVPPIIITASHGPSRLQDVLNRNALTVLRSSCGSVTPAGSSLGGVAMGGAGLRAAY